MKDVFLRMAWFALVACALAYGVFFVTGKMVFAQSSGENDPITVRDELGYGTHVLSGIVAVPQTCDELEEHVDKISATEYKIVFASWQDPAVQCENGETPRFFRDQFFAPSIGVTFVATMDGAPLAISVVPADEGHK